MLNDFLERLIFVKYTYVINYMIKVIQSSYLGLFLTSKPEKNMYYMLVGFNYYKKNNILTPDFSRIRKK